MYPRKATASVSYNGKRIDTKLAEYLQSFSYTDVASGESDSLSLNINDRDRKWIKSWFPSKGDTMAGHDYYEKLEQRGRYAEIKLWVFCD